jgi:phosphatidate cytidylyltransferase
VSTSSFFQLWSEPLFQGIVFITHIFIISLVAIYYAVYRKRPEFKSSFVSVLSWLFLAPFIFLMLGMKWPFPLILITLIAIYGAKVFFQMAGMFHRSYFVLMCYLAIVTCALAIYFDYDRLFELMPPLFFLGLCLIPMIRNSYKRMVQYVALTLVNFLLLWGFMHLGRILKLDHGVYILIYIIILTEIFENVYLRVSRHLKNIKIVSELTPKRSLEGYLIGAVATLGVAYILRDLLPNPANWWMLGSACFVFGSTGDTVLVFIRRDLGIRVYGSFVIGRGDFFTRIERLVFVAPACFYVIQYLQGVIHI